MSTPGTPPPAGARRARAPLAAAVASITALAAGACGEATQDVRAPLNLDRPSDVAFACWGGLRILGDGVADPGDAVVEMAQPMDGCRMRAQRMPEVPAGQENLDGQLPVPRVLFLGFVLQSVPGTVGIVTFPADHPSSYSSISVLLEDADPLIPGKNSVVVGALPVAIATDRAGCHVMTANAGSCDLSILAIDPLLDRDPGTVPGAEAVVVRNASGDPVLARPTAMVAEPDEADQPIGVACPAAPEGLVWIAYPECHLVAAVRPATGTIEAAVRFHEDGTVELTDGDVSCPAQCGGGGGFTPGERPVTLALEHDRRVDTRRLVIGADDSPVLTIVELDEAYLPLSLQRLPLEGEVGVIDVALSPQIGIGGAGGFEDVGTTGGQRQFVYAVATDETVRVADILGTYQECDAQVDPRYLRGITDVRRLSCLPVGDPATPPRRALARGPGIAMPSGATPMSVAIVRSTEHFNDQIGAPDPIRLVGYFAFVTTALGETVIVNIDDDEQRDAWDALIPLETMPHLVIAHQVRDRVPDRGAVAIAQQAGMSVRVCSDNGSPEVGGPHLHGQTALTFDERQVGFAKGYVLPSIRRIACEDGVTGVTSAISELAYAAPVQQRDAAFPDVRATRFDETWTMTWEGTLSRDTFNQAVSGPVVRGGLLGRDGGALTITEPSRPFCEMGVEPYDVAVLTGCDPSQGNSQCGLGERCYVHPDAVAATGACLKADDIPGLSSACRDFLVTRRRYAVLESTSGRLTVVPRRRILMTTPVDGCTSDDQCRALALYGAQLASGDHPQDDRTPPPERTYACGADPTRAPGIAGINRCMMTCSSSAECDAGTVCDGGFCVEGVVPPAECAPGVQRFTVRAGEAFTVIGASTGYLHSIIEDPDTGACVPDPDAHPLRVGRVPLDAPPCAGDGLTDLTPNPCATTIDHTELVPDYRPGTCEVQNSQGRLITRDAPAIRFRNPALTFHLVDPWYGGDLRCREDREGTLGMIPTVHAGMEIAIPIVAGFFTQRANLAAIFPVRARRGPQDSIWVVDEGDEIVRNPAQPSPRGKVFRVEPGQLGTINVIQ